jgi:periplasmic divalent cation tolerance protein
MTDDLCEVTITAPDPERLAELAHELIDLRLCASAHVVAPVRSIYRWEGVVRDITEARAFLRSRREQVGAIVHFVTDRHPYEVPT